MDDEPVVVKEANLGKANNPQELDEKCIDDADACEAEEPIEKKIMRQKEAKLGESDVKADPRDQCFDDGINCDATWDVSEPAVDTRKNVNPKVLKEANVGKAEKITEEQ